MRVALLEASHWHVSLYLNSLEASGIDVVAVSDSGGTKGTGNCSTVRNYAVFVKR